LLDATNFLALGWKKNVSFDDGLADTYEWLKEHYEQIRIS